MPTIADILNARRRTSIFDRVASGSSSTAPAPPTIFERLSPSPAPASPLSGITLGSILERSGQTLGRLGREVPNEIAANYADIVETVRRNPGAFGPAALPIVLSNLARGYQQGQEREARGGEPSLTETPFGTHTTGDPTVKGAAMVADPGNLVGTGIGAKIATGAAKLLGGAKGINQALIAFHGSPHKFDAFDISKVGTGEAGGTSFGLGINLSKDPKHAAMYKGEGGHLYKVDLPDDQLKSFIKWESPVSKEIADQLPPVDFTKPIPFGGGATIEKVGGEWKLKSGDSAFRLSEKEVMRMFGGENTGEQVYRRLVAALGDERKASMWLKDRGIKGIANSTERGAENFSVFDDKLPKILSRDGETIGAPPPPAPEYRGTHTAPMKDSGAPLHDLTGKGTVYPDDVYSINAARYYGHGEPEKDARLFQKIHALRNKPDAMVDIFRAVPVEAFVGGKQPKFEHGDWVTISREYAKQHGESTLNGKYKIMRARVPAKSLFTNGDSPYEFGLDRSVLGKE